MDRRLMKAALRGNVALLHELLQQDPNILDGNMVDCVAKGNNLHVQIAAAHHGHLRYNSQEILIAEPELLVPDFILKENPLHIAAQLGHVHFMREILSRKPHFARELNWEGQSPLHLASTKGHAEVVEVLLENDSDARLDKDFKGRTPLHIASMKGRVDLLEVLLGAEHEAAYVLTKEGEPILHLCSNHNQFESLKRLLDLVKDDEFINLRDSNDNTILHLVAAKGNTEMIQFLLRNKSCVSYINSVNVDKYTALDLLVNASKESSDHKKSKWTLRHYGAKRERKFKRARATLDHRKTSEPHSNWLNETKSTLMVLAVLIATVTYQAVINPPGGVWQETQDSPKVEHPPRQISSGENEAEKIIAQAPGPAIALGGVGQDCPKDGNEAEHKYTPGKAILSSSDTEFYIIFSISNQIGFIASVIIILLLISGFNVQHRSVMWVLTIAMWFAIATMIISYVIAFVAVTDLEALDSSSLSWMIIVVNSIMLSSGSILLLMAAHLSRLVVFCIKKCLFLKCKMGRSITS